MTFDGLTGIGMKPLEYTAAGWPAVGGDVLDILAGDPAKGKFGKALEHFPDPEVGKYDYIYIVVYKHGFMCNTLLLLGKPV